MQNAKCKMQNAKCKMPHMTFECAEWCIRHVAGREGSGGYSPPENPFPSNERQRRCRMNHLYHSNEDMPHARQRFAAS
jgi:hypothetical protein